MPDPSNQPEDFHMEPCVVDPRTEDWTVAEDDSVAKAACAGITPAITEAQRRRLEETW